MTSFVFPPMCCICLGPSSEPYRIGRTEMFLTHGATRTTVTASVEVPVCPRCRPSLSGFGAFFRRGPVFLQQAGIVNGELQWTVKFTNARYQSLFDEANRRAAGLPDLPAASADVETLQAGLQSPSPDVRKHCATLLGDRGAAAVGALAELERLTKDADRTVRQRAKWAVETIRDKGRVRG